MRWTIACAISRIGWPSSTWKNEASDESVKALVDAVVCALYDIPQRWYRSRPAPSALTGWPTTTVPRRSPDRRPGSPGLRPESLVVASYSGFSEELGAQAERFFTQRWIDAGAPRREDSGRLLRPHGPRRQSYVLVNFGRRTEDVLALAHEIGHGLHFLLAAPRGLLQMSAPVTVSETASVFGETLMFAHLLALAEDPAARFGLLAQQLDDAVGTVFRQVAIHRFEDAVHRERREHGELLGGADK